MPSFISFIPTPHEDVDAFFELAPVSASDVVYDLGSGDGRLLFAALERGAGRAVGVDLDPERIRVAREIARSKGLESKVTFIEADLMDVSLADATVLLCYLSSTASDALKPKFDEELKPGTKVVSEMFGIPGWKPARTIEREYQQFYLYITPAKG